MTLVTQQSVLPDVANEAMEALLRIHQPDVIELWNKNTEKDVTIQTFWDIRLVCTLALCHRTLFHILQHMYSNLYTTLITEII